MTLPHRRAALRFALDERYRLSLRKATCPAIDRPPTISTAKYRVQRLPLTRAMIVHWCCSHTLVLLGPHCRLLVRVLVVDPRLATTSQVCTGLALCAWQSVYAWRRQAHPSSRPHQSKGAACPATSANVDRLLGMSRSTASPGTMLTVDRRFGRLQSPGAALTLLNRW